MALQVGELVAFMSLDDSKFESGLQNAMDGLDASRWGSAADQASTAASDNLELDPTTFEGGADEAVDSLDSAEFAGAADEAGTAASTALSLDDTQYAADAADAAGAVDPGEFGAAAADASGAASDALELDATGFALDATDAAGAVDPGEFAASSAGASTAASDELELDSSAFDSSIEGMLGQFDPGEWQASAAGAAGAAVAGLGAGALTSTLIGAGESASTAAGRIEHVAGNLGKFGGEHTVVADRMVENAQRMAGETGVSPIAIQEAQAMLLTFDSLSDSAGEAGGTFDRVTQISMDLAAQGFGSVDQNARMLGRALEDPERGMTRLERMGVILNDTQKEQVTAMMEAGDAAGAQAILLGQAESASEGTAAATADASDKMAVAWEVASQKLGEALLPAFERFTELAIGAAEWVGENETLALGLAAAVAGVAGAVLAANAGILIYRATMVAWTVVTQAATVAQRALNLAMRMNPIGIIITLIAALVAGLIWFFTQTDTGQGDLARLHGLAGQRLAVAQGHGCRCVRCGGGSHCWGLELDQGQDPGNLGHGCAVDPGQLGQDPRHPQPGQPCHRGDPPLGHHQGGDRCRVGLGRQQAQRRLEHDHHDDQQRGEQRQAVDLERVEQRQDDHIERLQQRAHVGTNAFNNVVSFVAGIPGRVLSALGNLGIDAVQFWAGR